MRKFTGFVRISQNFTKAYLVKKWNDPLSTTMNLIKCWLIWVFLLFTTIRSDTLDQDQLQCMVNLCQNYNLSTGFYCLPEGKEYLWCSGGNGWVMPCGPGTSCNCDDAGQNPCIFPGDTSLCSSLGVGNSVEKCIFPPKLPCHEREPIDIDQHNLTFGETYHLGCFLDDNHQPVSNTTCLFSTRCNSRNEYWAFDDVNLKLEHDRIIIRGDVRNRSDGTLWFLDFEYHHNITMKSPEEISTVIHMGNRVDVFYNPEGHKGRLIRKDKPSIQIELVAQIFNQPLKLIWLALLHYSPFERRYGGIGWIEPVTPLHLKDKCYMYWEFEVSQRCNNTHSSIESSLSDEYKGIRDDSRRSSLTSSSTIFESMIIITIVGTALMSGLVVIVGYLFWRRRIEME